MRFTKNHSASCAYCDFRIPTGELKMLVRSGKGQSSYCVKCVFEALEQATTKSINDSKTFGKIPLEHWKILKKTIRLATKRSKILNKVSFSKLFTPKEEI